MSAPHWFDARPLTEVPEKVADASDSARSRFREQWRRRESLKDRLAAMLDADVRGMVSDWWRDIGADASRLERFAAANGLSYQRQQYDLRPKGIALDGMIFRDGERRDAMSWGDPCTAEFGNWSSVGQELELAFGYIALRHDLGLPHVVIDARANDASSLRGSRIYAKKTDFTSLSQNYRGSDSASPLADSVAIWSRSISGPRSSRSCSPTARSAARRRHWRSSLRSGCS